MNREDVKAFLFARWLATCYADELMDANMCHSATVGYDPSTALSVLNRESGHWYKERLDYFNKNVYPEYEANGSTEKIARFLNF